MKNSLLASAALICSLAAGAALAQPAGGLCTATGPSGGIVGGGAIGPGSTGTISTPSTNSGSNTLYGSGGTSTGYNSSLGSMPDAPATATPSTPNQAPAGSVPGVVNQP